MKKFEGITNNEKNLYKKLLLTVSDSFAYNSCNDFNIPYSQEVYDLVIESAARNLRCKSLEEFVAHPQYKDYLPRLSKDGHTIYTQDYVVLEILTYKLGLKDEESNY